MQEILLAGTGYMPDAGKAQAFFGTWRGCIFCPIDQTHLFATRNRVWPGLVSLELSSSTLTNES